GTPVDLEGFEINVRVDLIGDKLLVGIQRTRESLARRIRRARPLRTSLKPTIAAAMVRLARCHRGARSLLDPMCGTGTIPIEAREANPELLVAASDWDEETVATARATIARHGLEIEVRRLDVREAAAGWGRPFDAVVTDPPYGLRQGRRVRLGALYTFVLRGCLDALADDGRLVVICPRRKAFEGAVRRLPLTVVHERVVETGGLFPRIWVLERR
ncbi:MAG: methyltransferase domain-containing protein, partial [Acidobacteria bacterium]